MTRGRAAYAAVWVTVLAGCYVTGRAVGYAAGRVSRWVDR